MGVAQNAGTCTSASMSYDASLVSMQPAVSGRLETNAPSDFAGEPDGQYRLGLCYERGKGCMGDAQRAMRLYDAAARAGHLAAAARAGAMQTGGEEY